MTFEATKDGSGYFWTIPAEAPSVQIECWWNRIEKEWVRQDGRGIKAEHFIIRQDNGVDDGADIILMTQGQVYDLIKALNDAMEKP